MRYTRIVQPNIGMALLRLRPGLLSHISRELGLSRAAVGQWKIVPAERLPEVERASGYPRWALRPDICPPPPVDQPISPSQWGEPLRRKQPAEETA